MQLHSIAAYYPDNPTEEEKQYALDFLNGFAHLYPCKACREHLQKSMKKYPPKLDLGSDETCSVNSRKEFMLYLCTIHNIVNRTLLKPVYPCNIELLEERWRKGCPECWSSESKTSSQSTPKAMPSEDSIAFECSLIVSVAARICESLESSSLLMCVAYTHMVHLVLL